MFFKLQLKTVRRSDREAEGARLLSEYGPQAHLGFESLLLRQSKLRFSTENRNTDTLRNNLFGIFVLQTKPATSRSASFVFERISSNSLVSHLHFLNLHGFLSVDSITEARFLLRSQDTRIIGTSKSRSLFLARFPHEIVSPETRSRANGATSRSASFVFERISSNRLVSHFIFFNLNGFLSVDRITVARFLLRSQDTRIIGTSKSRLLFLARFPH